MQDDWYDEVGWRYDTPAGKSREWHERYDGVMPPLNDERLNYKIEAPPRKVVIVGGLHAGKSEIAKVAATRGFTRVSIADPIKQAATMAVNGADIYLRKIGAIRPKTYEHGWKDIDVLADKDANREIFQFVGEYFRRDNPSIWIDYFIRMHGHLAKAVVDDARSSLEADTLRDRGWTVVKVVRPLEDRIRSVQEKAERSGRKMTTKQVKKLLRHDTEAQIDDIQADIVIENDGTLAELINKARMVLTSQRATPVIPVDTPMTMTVHRVHPLDPRSVS